MNTSKTILPSITVTSDVDAAAIDVGNTSFNSSTGNEMVFGTCALHKKKQKLYCKKCVELICTECLDSHEFHNVSSYKSYFKKIERDVEEIEARLGDQLKILKKSREYLGQVYQNDGVDFFRRQKVIVSEWFKKLHDELDFQEAEINKELGQYHKENKRIYREADAIYESHINLIESLIHDLENKDSNIIPFVKAHSVASDVLEKSYEASNDILMNQYQIDDASIEKVKPLIKCISLSNFINLSDTIQSGEEDKKMELLLKSMVLDPDNSLPFFKLGSTFERFTINDREIYACDLLIQAIELNPNYSAAYQKLSNLATGNCIINGKELSVEDLFKKSIQLNPSCASQYQKKHLQFKKESSKTLTDDTSLNYSISSNSISINNLDHDHDNDQNQDLSEKRFDDSFSDQPIQLIITSPKDREIIDGAGADNTSENLNTNSFDESSQPKDSIDDINSEGSDQNSIEFSDESDRGDYLKNKKLENPTTKPLKFLKKSFQKPLSKSIILMKKSYLKPPTLKRYNSKNNLKSKK